MTAGDAKAAGPSLLEAARMNSGAYYSDIDHKPSLPGWTLVERNEALGLDRWEHADGYVYLALAGTRKSRRDVIDSLKVFLGQVPAERMEAVDAYVREHCQEALAADRLAVGGHSLGGLVATEVAARHGLPALIQNAPGYFKQGPDPQTCSRVVEIRTARDVVSDWGSHVPRVITLHDPAAPGWKLSLLHAVDRQIDLICDQPAIAQARLHGASLAGIEEQVDLQPTGNTLRSIMVSWQRLRHHCRQERQAASTVKRLTP